METTISIDILNNYPKVEETVAEEILQQELQKAARKLSY